MSTRQRLALIACLLPAVAAHAQQGSGRLYEVTTRMEMPGMPMQPPPRTMRVCAPANETSDKMLAGSDDCEVTQRQVSGNKTTYRMACTGEMAMTGEGEMEEFATGYRGRMKATMGSGGDRQSMTMSYEGKLVGSCNHATDSPAAQAASIRDQQCASQLTSHAAHQLFTDRDGLCASQRAEFCANLAKSAASPRFVALAAVDGSAWQAVAACGQKREAIVAAACDTAARDVDLPFVQQYCPTHVTRLCDVVDPLKHSEFVLNSCPGRAKALAAKHCAGRDYTAIQLSPYRGYCQGMAADNLRQRNAGTGEATMDVLQHGAALGIANGSSGAGDAAQAVGATSHLLNAGQAGGDTTDKTLDVIEAGSQVLPIGGDKAMKVGAAAGLLKSAKSLGGLFSRKNKGEQEDQEQE